MIKSKSGMVTTYIPHLTKDTFRDRVIKMRYSLLHSVKQLVEVTYSENVLFITAAGHALDSLKSIYEKL